MKRLSIVVPYRAREHHLKIFVPHVRAFFSRDKLDHAIPYQVLVVEQEHGLPFNRGAIKNVGFLLGQDSSDYTCFHDVDYLPIWADYSWTDHPTPIVWYGAEVRPIAPGRSSAVAVNQMESFFGGVLLVPNAAFMHVDGYSNSYWGWGSEDVDLRNRFLAASVQLGRRKGSFDPLDHNHDAFLPDGSRSPLATENERLFERRWKNGAASNTDGLSTLDFEVLSRETIPEGPKPERTASWEKVTVRLKLPAPSDQLLAFERRDAPVVARRSARYRWRT